MTKGLFIYSLIMFVFALVITILSLTHVDIEKYLPYVQLMNIGVLISVGLTIFTLRKRPKPNLPTWTRLILMCLTIVAVYFFFVSFLNMTPVSSDGKYFLANHGNPRQEISEQEFIKIKMQNFVRISSMCVVFCGWTTSILYYSIKPQTQTKHNI